MAGADSFLGARVGPDERILVTRRVGKGGSGSIYVGYDEGEQRQVALKVLDPALASNQKIVTRFMREGRRFGALDHPNLVRVYGWGQKDGRLFLIEEYVDGRNLYELLTDEGALKPERALRICRDVARGLEEAHRNGIVHRDLKPENVMVSRSDGSVKVLDFGIAKDLQDTRLNLTGLGMYIGTPAYSAPEQIRGETVDHRADIFSLGVILYELLTGKVAFEGRHSTEILQATLRSEPRPVRDLNARVTEPVAHLMAWMMAKEPGKRPESMEAVALEVESILDAMETFSDADAASLRRDLKGLFE